MIYRTAIKYQQLWWTWVYVKVIRRLQAFCYTNMRVTQSLCHCRASCSIYQSQFLSLKYAKNTFEAVALPHFALGELTTLPNTLRREMRFSTPEQKVKTVNFDVCENPPKLIGYHRKVRWTTAKPMSVSRAYATMSVSVSLSVCLWRKCIGALANLGFKFRSKFSAHCREEGRSHNNNNISRYASAMLGPLA